MRGPVKSNYVRRQTLGNPGRRDMRGEPQPINVKRADQPPPPPKELKGVAREEWQIVVPQLHACGLLSMLDLGALKTYCELVAVFDAAQADVQRRGAFAKDGAMNPSSKTLLRVSTLLNKMREAPGLTPQSRARLTGRGELPPNRADDEFARFLAGDSNGNGPAN